MGGWFAHSIPFIATAINRSTMECLRDYVGVRGCSYAASDSGMYINELPGIEFANIDQLANADQVSLSGVWSDVQNRAIIRFRQDVLGKISGFDRRYRLKQITQTVDIGKDIDASAPTVAAVATRGQTIELNKEGDQYVGSNMQGIYLQGFNFYLIANAAIYDFAVTDLDTGDILWNSAEPLTVGWNLIKVEELFSVTRISITIDTTACDTAELSLDGFALSDPYSNWSMGFGYNNNYLFWNWGCDCSSMVRGYQDIAGIETFGIDTFGISAIFSVRCTYDNIICKNKMYFASAFRLCLAIELMAERMFSSRINRWTTVDLAKAKELKKYFEVSYRGGEYDGAIYEGELKTCIDGIELNLNDCCLECDQMIKFAEPRF